jgi:phospholipid:diacylglycerol acyltransferase
MSTLRQRSGNAPTTSSAEQPSETTPADKTDDSGDSGHNIADNIKEEIRHVEVPVFKRRSKRGNGLIFGLGGLFGIFIALFFANHNEVISFDALMDLNLDSFIDVIPAGMVRDAKEFTVCDPFFSFVNQETWC